MSLNKYLEMMTPNERSRAMSRGQTNLDPKKIEDLGITKSKTNKPKLTEDQLKLALGYFYDHDHSFEENLKDAQETWVCNQTTPDFKNINNPIRLILMNNQFFWNNSFDMVHDNLLMAAILQGHIELITYLEDSKESWDKDSSSAMNKFLCLHYVPQISETKIAPSESYPIHKILDIPEHYITFLKNSFNLELITDEDEYNSFHNNFNNIIYKD